MRTAVVGVGRMGRRHAQVVRDLGLRLIAFADRSPEALRQAGADFGVPANGLFASVPDLLSTARPECVIVATHAPTHCEYTCQAAEAGVRYILCEKPMGVSLAECDRMLAACQRAGAKLAVNHQMRFMQQYTEPKRIVNTPAFGGLRSVTVVAGNFGLAMNGSHYFEMFRYLTNEPPVEVQAWFSPEKVPNPRGPEFEDRAGSVRLTTASGKRFYLDTGADQGHGIKVVYAGPSGQLIVDELRGTMTLGVREEVHRALPTTRYGMPEVVTAQTIEPAT